MSGMVLAYYVVASYTAREICFAIYRKATKDQQISLYSSFLAF